MIARPRSATATTSLPASLILTPRDLKHYRRFQAQTTTIPPKSQGRLPTAAQYADFQAWLAKRDSGYFSDTPLADIASYVESTSQKKVDKGKASVCGHALHPTHEDQAERCPVCTVEMHITYMKLLTVALEDAGGLVKQRWEAIDHECPALQAWYAGKLACVWDFCWLETLAQKEKEYDQEQQQQQQQNRQSTQATNDIKTATQALEIYWASMESNPTTMQSPRKKTVRSVVFCPETSFERGRDQLYFWRKSPRYEAGGKYASSSDGDDGESDEEECEEQEASMCGEKKNMSMRGETPSAIKDEVTLGQNVDDEEESDDEASDESDDESDDGSEEEDEDEDDEDDDEEVDGSYVVFEYEEVIVQGAEFVVFEN